MIIRKATVHDAEKIREISLKYSVSRFSRQKGFVDFNTPDAERYSKLIDKNPYFYVAEEDNGVVGFLSNFSSQRLKDSFGKEDQIINHLLLKKKKPFIYTEQIAVLPRYIPKCAGNQLFNRLFNDLKDSEYSKVWCAVSHKPNRNVPAMKTAERQGFKVTEEIEVYNGLIFGIYKKDLD